MTMRTGLARSKNMVSIRILQAVGPKTARSGSPVSAFEAEKHPAYLTMALGAGSVTPNANGMWPIRCLPMVATASTLG
jgi:penicillin-binding protein 1A